MELASVDVNRFEIGLFGDARLEKRGLGAIKHSWHRRDRAFWRCLAASGAARSGLDGFCAIRP